MSSNLPTGCTISDINNLFTERPSMVEAYLNSIEKDIDSIDEDTLELMENIVKWVVDIVSKEAREETLYENAMYWDCASNEEIIRYVQEKRPFLQVTLKDNS